MISIVICSRGPKFRQTVIQNIAATIGVPHEVVVIDNSANQYGICAAYNEGAARSNYDILCFAHEDITFRSNNWGKTISHILRDSSIGAVGIAGGKWLAKVPSSWWGCGRKHLSINLHDQGRNQEYSQYTYSNPENKQLVDVAAVDGMWICSRKDVWRQYPFDEHTFPDFHFYDVDFCANMLSQYRVCVTFEVAITHFSRGNFNDSWYVNADRFYRKHAKRLPLGLPVASPLEIQLQTYAVCKGFVLEIVKRNLPARMGYQYLACCIGIEPFSRDTLWLVRHYASFAWQSRGSRQHTVKLPIPLKPL